jgi:hypothetical protein
MVSSISNNQAQHRTWLDNEQRQTQKSGRTAGFEYAIQPDGTCFAERAWRERQQLTSSSFTFAVSASSSRNRYQTSSLAQVERSVRTATSQYQASVQNMPPPPVVPPTNQYINNSTSNAQQQQQQTTPTFLSPSRRIRNRHNAVFGQHLPNAQNSPACAGKVFGAQAAVREEQARCSSLLKENVVPSIMHEHDDDDDALFMDMDVDKLIAEREQQQKQAFDYGDGGRMSDVSAISRWTDSS